MEVKEISSSRYQSIFKQYDHVYNTVKFNSLNERKCEKIVYLLFTENKVSLGLIAGLRDGVLTSPFSAPFSGFSTNGNTIRIERINDAIKLLDEYSKQNDIYAIKFILPPYFYNEDILSKTYYSLTINGYTTIKDINYHFLTSDFTVYKDSKIKKRSREYLDKAESLELSFKQVFSDTEKKIVYNIIKENRECKDRPIHLTYEQLIDTERIVTVDFFLIYYQDRPIASSVAYHVSEHVVQIVFWGNVSEYTLYRPMYFVAYKLFEFYSNIGFKVIDVTTGSVNGIPNFGLCHFKENIGCSAGIKYTMQKTIL